MDGWKNGDKQSKQENGKDRRTTRKEEKGEQMEMETTKNVGKYYICFLMHSRDCLHHRFIIALNIYMCIRLYLRI